MIGVRPPDYFPPIPFMALAAHVDALVLADTFQYSRQSFHNRARLRNPNGWQWISVPLQTHSPGTPITETLIDNSEPWQRKHWRAFVYNYRTTPYFEFYEPRFRPLFETRWTSLADLTCATIEVACQLLELKLQLPRASSLEGAPQHLPAMLEAAGAGAGPLLALEDAAPRNRQLVEHVHVLQVREPTYRQNFEGFEQGMSFMDLLFNAGPRARSVLREAATAGV